MSSARHSSRLAIAGAAGYEKIMRAKQSSSRDGGRSSGPRLNAVAGRNELPEDFVTLGAITAEGHRSDVIHIFEPTVHAAQLLTSMANAVSLALLAVVANENAAVGLIPGPARWAQVFGRAELGSPFLRPAGSPAVLASYCTTVRFFITTQWQTNPFV